MKKLAALLASACLLQCAPLSALTLESMHPKAYPLVLNVDGEKRTADGAFLLFPSYAADAKIAVDANVSEGKGVSIGDPDMSDRAPEQRAYLASKSFGKILGLAKAGNTDGLSKLLSNPGDAKRAQKFVAMMDPENAVLKSTAFLADDSIVFFFDNPKSKLRPDMNFMAFKPGKENWRWDLSEKSPLLTLLSEAVRAKTSHHINPQDFGREKTGLNSKFVPLENGQNADNPAFQFYQTAQKEFYGMRLDEYSKFMTPKSAEVFKNQFLLMPRDEQEKVLSDYIQWHKVFYGIYDTGNVKVVVFKRVKECATHEMYDCAYIVQTDDGLKLANFGQNQGAFAEFAVEQAKASGF